MDVLKTANKVGAAGKQVVASALLQRQLETERGVLAGLRAEAMSLRAQIGEEMYKLWQGGQPGPIWLEQLCQAVEGTSAAIVRQRAVIEQLVSGAGEPELPLAAPGGAAPDTPAPVTNCLPPAGDSPARPSSIKEGEAPIPCPHCGEIDAPGRRFCGYCGTALSRTR